MVAHTRELMFGRPAKTDLVGQKKNWESQRGTEFVSSAVIK